MDHEVEDITFDGGTEAGSATVQCLKQVDGLEAMYPHGPTEGVAAQLKYLVPGGGKRGRWGVLVTANEEEGYAEVTAEIPPGLPERSRMQLEVFRYRRFEYTDADRLWDEVHGNPAWEWQHASCFAEAVGDAVGSVVAAFKQAARAHAMGEEWILPFEPPQRDDSKYAGYGSDLRVGLLVAMHGEDYEELLRVCALEEAGRESNAASAVVI